MNNPRGREPSESPLPQWTIYLLIAVAAFASGSALTLLLRPAGAPQPAAIPLTSSPAPLPAANVMPSTTTGDPVTLGNSYYDQQNWTAAIEQYERAIALGSDTPDVRTDLGNAYRFAGNPRKALEEYQIAQRQNPNHEQSLFNQGALYAQSLGDPITGAAKWREFVNHFPSSPRATEARRLLAEFESEFGTPPAQKRSSP